MSRLLFLLLLLASTSAFAAELAPEGTVERKFQRGLINTLLSPMEISHGLKVYENKSSPLFPSWLWGAAKGVIDMGIRATVGVYEMVTAPIPSPPDYRKIYTPELAVELLPEKKS